VKEVVIEETATEEAVIDEDAGKEKKE